MDAEGDLIGGCGHGWLGHRGHVGAMPSAFTVREREGKEEEEHDAGRLQVGSAWMPAWITTWEGERRRQRARGSWAGLEERPSWLLRPAGKSPRAFSGSFGFLFI